MKKLFLALMLLLIPAAIVLADVETAKPAPDFTLTDTNGNTHSLSQYKGKYVVLEWFNPDCPFVKKQYDQSGNMPKIQQEYIQKGVVWLSIDSSSAGKEGNYSADKINDWAKKEHSNATALFLDSDGKIAKLYGAKTTPHMFVIDPQGTLIYQGAIDSIPSADTEDIAKATNYVQAALDESMAGKPVTTPSTKSYGCSVKY